VQRAVILWIRDPDTPGGFNDSMACKPASNSATAEDMANERLRPGGAQFIQYKVQLHRDRSRV